MKHSRHSGHPGRISLAFHGLLPVHVTAQCGSELAVCQCAVLQEGDEAAKVLKKRQHVRVLNQPRELRLECCSARVKGNRMDQLWCTPSELI